MHSASLIKIAHDLTRSVTTSRRLFFSCALKFEGLVFRDKVWFPQRCQPMWLFVSWPPLRYAAILDFPWIPGKGKRENEYQTMSSYVPSGTFPSPQTPALMSSALASAHGHMWLQGWLGNWGRLWSGWKGKVLEMCLYVQVSTTKNVCDEQILSARKTLLNLDPEWLTHSYLNWYL